MNDVKEKRIGSPDVVNVDAVEILKSLNKGAKMFELSIAIEQLVAAIRDTGKAGSISLTLDIAPTNAEGGQVFVTATIKGKLPRQDEKPTLFFTTKSNAMVRNNPDQTEMPFSDKQ